MWRIAWLLFITGWKLVLAQDVLATYPISWNDVPSTSQRSTSQTCICDVTSFVCDTNCCCDTQYCPEPLIALWLSRGSCLPEGPPFETLDYCQPQNYFHQVNLPTSSNLQAVTRPQQNAGFFRLLMCISSSRNPSMGNWYEDPGAGQSASSETISLGSCSVNVDVGTPPVVYNFSSAIDVIDSASNAGLLQVPYPAFSRECTDSYRVGFMVNIPAVEATSSISCQRSITARELAALCTSASPLSAGTYANQQYAPNPLKNSYQPFALGLVQFLDPSTGVLTPVNVSTVPAPQYNSPTGSCSNVVRSINYIIIYTRANDGGDGGDIAQVRVSLVLTSVVMAPSAAPSAIPQDVSVLWIPTTSAINQQVQTFSGNPGYNPGLPVLAGLLVTEPGGSRQAISRFRDGFPVPAPSAQGSCSPASTTAARFGANMTSSCSVTMSAADLRTFCEADTGDMYVQQTLGEMWSDLINGTVYVGIWGNSNFTTTSDWIQVVVEGELPSSNTQWSSLDQSCSNVVVGYNITFVTGVAYASGNIVNKVLYATVCFQTGTWSFPADTSQSTAKFLQTYVVQFRSLQQYNGYTVSAPQPPLYFTLNPTLLYPFLPINAAAMSGASLASIILASALALLVIMYAM